MSKPKTDSGALWTSVETPHLLVPSSAGSILDQRHDVAMRKLAEDFGRSCIHSPERQARAQAEAKARAKVMIEGGGLHPNPLAGRVGLQFPATPLPLAEERAIKELLRLAEKLEGQPKIVVNCDCLMVGCIATVLSLSANRHLDIRLDCAYTYGTEQVCDLNMDANADILITVDGSFVLAGAVDYQIVAWPHKETQCCVISRPDEAGRRPSTPGYRYIRQSSFQEQVLMKAVGRPVVHHAAEDFEEFRDQLERQLRPGDLILMPGVIADRARERFPNQSAIVNEYEILISLSVHRKWLPGGTLDPCMRRFVQLFIHEWKYLREDQMQGGWQARELLFRDHPGAGYVSNELLDRLGGWGRLRGLLDRAGIPQDAGAARTEPVALEAPRMMPALIPSCVRPAEKPEPLSPARPTAAAGGTETPGDPDDLANDERTPNHLKELFVFALAGPIFEEMEKAGGRPSMLKVFDKLKDRHSERITIEYSTFKTYLRTNLQVFFKTNLFDNEAGELGRGFAYRLNGEGKKAWRRAARLVQGLPPALIEALVGRRKG